MYLPVPLSINTSFSTPPAVMINRIMAMPVMPLVSHFITSVMPMPRLNPNTYAAINTATSSAIFGFPKKLMVAMKSEGVGLNRFMTTANVINMTGSKAMAKLEKTDGGLFISAGLSTIVLSVDAVPMFLRRLPRSGPAIITMGIMSIKPYNKVRPRSAPKALTNTTGPG